MRGHLLIRTAGFVELVPPRWKQSGVSSKGILRVTARADSPHFDDIAKPSEQLNKEAVKRRV
jgi:hypothetical protein